MRTVEAGTISETPSGVARCGRIVIADDIESNLTLLTRLLAPDGHVLDLARDGNQALQVVADRPPDLVLLDVMMPGLTGFEVCRELKRNAATRLIPVVLLILGGGIAIARMAKRS